MGRDDHRYRPSRGAPRSAILDTTSWKVGGLKRLGLDPDHYRTVGEWSDVIRPRSQAVSRVDEILDLLDHGSQHTTNSHDPGWLPSGCWRCGGATGDGPSGVCDTCRTVLLAEIPDDAPVAWPEPVDPWPELTRAACGDGLAAALADLAARCSEVLNAAAEPLAAMAAQVQAFRPWPSPAARFIRGRPAGRVRYCRHGEPAGTCRPCARGER